MSLLQGIVFIPREKKEKVDGASSHDDKKRKSGKSDNDRNESNDHKKSKKEEKNEDNHKKHKKHKKDHHKSSHHDKSHGKIHKRKRNSREGKEHSSSGEDSGEDSDDMKDFSKYAEEMKVIKEQELEQRIIKEEMRNRKQRNESNNSYNSNNSNEFYDEEEDDYYDNSEKREKRDSRGESEEYSTIERDNRGGDDNNQSLSVKQQKTATIASTSVSKANFSSLLGSLSSKSRERSEEHSQEHSAEHTGENPGERSEKHNGSSRNNENMVTLSNDVKHADNRTEQYSKTGYDGTSKEHSSQSSQSSQPQERSSATNQSMAELFRARLKKTKGVVKDNIGNIPENIPEKIPGNLLEEDSREDGDILFEDETLIRNQVIHNLRKNMDHNTIDTRDNTTDKNNKYSNNNAKDSKNDFSSKQAELSLLLKSEKYEKNDMDENFRENVLRLGKNYKGDELGKTGAFGNGNMTGADEEEDIDMKLFENKHDNKYIIQEEKIKTKKQILKNLNDTRKDNNTTNNQINEVDRKNEKQREITNRCRHCSASNNYQSYLTISKGEHTMLRMKTGPKTLGSGHCIITPIMHTSSFMKCDEEVEIEVSRYKSCLRRMYECNNMSVLFLESAVRFGRSPHAVIDCVPVPLGIESEARMCFREAFNSTDEEWSTHKKLIDLTPLRPLSHAVPKHWEYLAVEWGSKTEAKTDVIGAAHAVENETKITDDFCLNVVAGMLDVDIMMNKGQKVNIEKEKKDVESFTKMWESYDWTQYT